MDINPNTNNSHKYQIHNIPQNLTVTQLLHNTEQQMGRIYLIVLMIIIANTLF